MMIIAVTTFALLAGQVPVSVKDSAQTLRIAFETECREELGYGDRENLIAAHTFQLRRCVVKKLAAAQREKELLDRSTRIQDVSGNAKSIGSKLQKTVEKRFLRDRSQQMFNRALPKSELNKKARYDKLRNQRAILRMKVLEEEKKVYEEAQDN
jgi:hypothetical protein